ncbi:hypothetical protein ACFWJY_19940 [Streptomyces anulatus]|uniref:hypothetical protein n=1 Tax=Streptomyces anulatus TaxID=1892 RepID=UPI00365F273D
MADWLATAGKGGKWVAKADGFFKKLSSKNPAFTACALPKSFSGASARAGLRARPVEFENFGNEVFGSPAGLIYQRMTNGKHRIDHVMDHTRTGPPGKPRHGIFKQKDERKLLRFVDDAWKKRDESTKIVAPQWRHGVAWAWVSFWAHQRPSHSTRRTRTLGARRTTRRNGRRAC